jgi:hypothetical protein
MRTLKRCTTVFTSYRRLGGFFEVLMQLIAWVKIGFDVLLPFSIFAPRFCLL